MLLVLRYRELLWDVATLQSTALGCRCTTEYCSGMLLVLRYRELLWDVAALQSIALFSPDVIQCG